MKNTIFITFLIILFSCTTTTKTKDDIKKSCKEDQNKEEESFETYDFDTLLSNGFYLSYNISANTKEKIQSLTLMKGSKKIRTLNETNLGTLHKNLGYIGADFGETFVFVQSYGSGNPSDIQLIEKESGNEIRHGSWVDADEKEKILLYIKNIHDENEMLMLYDLETKREMEIHDFKNSKCVTESIFGIRDCVEIDTVSKNEIVLKVESENLRKKYYR
jgi:hypothetical protein